jgi:AmiR/NasT family two-component response regulator
VTAWDAAEQLVSARSDLAVATPHAEHLQERHRLTQEQAFERLRDLSQRSNVKLHDVAEQIIYTGETQQRPG